MGALKTIILIVAVVAILYFGTQQLGISLPDNAAKLREIDAKFGIGKERLSPTNPEEIAKYQYELKKLDPSSTNEENIIQMKMNLSDMQKALLVLSENYPKIDFTYSECSVAGPLGSSDAAAANALAYARKALGLQAEVKPVQGLEYITSKETSNALNFSTKAVEQLKNNIDTTCGK
ncbi:MAG TPA: hypothetical protein VJH23_03865 [archaeon]|nr:hypothetical protein [archaeon]